MDRELKILLRLPNWIGDSAMASGAFETLKSHFPNAIFSILGPKSSCDLYKRDIRIENIFIDESKNSKNRLRATINLAKRIGPHNIAISFSNTFFSALCLYFTNTPLRLGYAKNFRSLFLSKTPKYIKNIHQVELYLNLVNELCALPLITSSTKPNKIQMLNLTSKNIFFPLPKQYKCIGIAPSATYGSAKRWVYYAKLINNLLDNYVVVLFGKEGENRDILDSINTLHRNFIDLTNKTSIEELCDLIAKLDLFIGNDSGPMHIADALNIPLIAIFGPTPSFYAKPYRSKHILFEKNPPCSPCQKRECPLKHHNCMKEIKVEEVMKAVSEILDAS